MKHVSKQFEVLVMVGRQPIWIKQELSLQNGIISISFPRITWFNIINNNLCSTSTTVNLFLHVFFFLEWTPNKEDRGFLLWELEKLNVLLSENSGVPGTVGVDLMNVKHFRNSICACRSCVSWCMMYIMYIIVYVMSCKFKTKVYIILLYEHSKSFWKISPNLKLRILPSATKNTSTLNKKHTTTKRQLRGKPFQHTSCRTKYLPQTSKRQGPL